MEDEKYSVTYGLIYGRPVWELTRGSDRIFLRGVPPDVNVRKKYPNGTDVFVGDRFGWDGHILPVRVDELAEIVEALTAGQLPASFVKEVQRSGTEYHAPCGGG